MLSVAVTIAVVLSVTVIVQSDAVLFVAVLSLIAIVVMMSVTVVVQSDAVLSVVVLSAVVILIVVMSSVLFVAVVGLSVVCSLSVGDGGKGSSQSGNSRNSVTRAGGNGKSDSSGVVVVVANRLCLSYCPNESLCGRGKIY